MLCSQDEIFTMDGRRMEVSMALPRNDIEGMRKALKKQEKSVNKDKRNLYLLREGCKFWESIIGIKNS